MARLFSLITKVIGLQYALTSLFFLLIGFSLAVVFRWQLAYPGQPVPIIGRWLGELTGEWEIACSQVCGLGHYRLASQPAGL